MKLSDWTQLSEPTQGRNKKALFRCKCGVEKMVNYYSVKSGRSRSCRKCTKGRIDNRLVKTCPVCKVEFKTYPSIDKKNCSKECSFQAIKKDSYTKYKVNCQICDKEFLPPRQAEGADFCSYECLGISNRKEKVERNGYWYICMPDHPNSNKANYVPEHHLVMEEKLGHYIEKGMVVHHIDRDKKNNNIDNLMYMTDSDHKSLHIKEDRRWRDGRFR